MRMDLSEVPLTAVLKASLGSALGVPEAAVHDVRVSGATRRLEGSRLLQGASLVSYAVRLPAEPGGTDLAAVMQKATELSTMSGSEAQLVFVGAMGAQGVLVDNVESVIAPHATTVTVVSQPTEPPTDAPTVGSPTDAPTDGPPTDAPTDGPPTNAPTDGPNDVREEEEEEADEGVPLVVILGTIFGVLGFCCWLLVIATVYRICVARRRGKDNQRAAAKGQNDSGENCPGESPEAGPSAGYCVEEESNAQVIVQVEEAGDRPSPRVDGDAEAKVSAEENVKMLTAMHALFQRSAPAATVACQSLEWKEMRL